MANLVAAEIVNLLAGDYPKAELYGMIHRLLVTMLCMAGEEQAGRWKAPSDN
jgi:hypothetical protein